MAAGKFYQFRFRAKNELNDQDWWSAYSAVATFPVADAPGKPVAAPELLESTKTAITVGWAKAADT